MRNNHNTSDTWIPVYSNEYMDYVLKDEIAGLNGVAASGPNYVRFTDGTQICWNILTPPTAGLGYLWTYSQAFSAKPTVLWGIQHDGATGMYGSTYLYKVETNQAGIYVKLSDGYSYPMIAVGRWK